VHVFAFSFIDFLSNYIPIPYLPAVKLIGFPLVLLASVIWHKICSSLLEKLKGTFIKKTEAIKA